MNHYHSPSLINVLVKHFGAVFLLLLGMNHLSAQTLTLSPFTMVSEASLNLTSDGQIQKNKLIAAPHKGDLQYALVGFFSDWGNTSNGRVSFSIPGYEGKTFQAEPLEISYLDPESYTYIGKIDGDANANFSITRDPSGITGFIQLSTEFFSFYPLGGNKVVFVQDAPSPGLTCGTAETPSSDPDRFCLPKDNECSAFLDIQILIHLNAASATPVGFTTMAALQFNTVQFNSRIYNKKVRVTTSELLFSYPLTGDIATDVSGLLYSTLLSISPNP